MGIIEAIVNIGNVLQLEEDQSVTAIQQEDGSGLKWNYQVNGGEWKFISFSREQMLLRLAECGFYEAPIDRFIE